MSFNKSLDGIGMIFDWYCLRNWQVYTFIRADESMKPRHETECHVCERRLVFHANIQVRVQLRTCWSRRRLLLDLFLAIFHHSFVYCAIEWNMLHLLFAMGFNLKCHVIEGSLYKIANVANWGVIGVLTSSMFTPCSGQSQVQGNHGHMAVYTWSQKQINWLQIWNNNDNKTGPMTSPVCSNSQSVGPWKK